MITLAEYFGPWRGHKDVTDEVIDHANDLVLRVNNLMSLALADGVQFPYNSVTGTQISGNKYGGFRPQECTQGTPLSAHKTGQAVDLYDPDNWIDLWCFKNEDRLKRCGIYLEHPDCTRGWSHWGTRAPKSGHVVYWP